MGSEMCIRDSDLENADFFNTRKSESVSEFALKTSHLPKTRKQMVDRLTELDSDPLISYRCSNCRNCHDCKTSVRSDTISQLELIEQTVIEKSVKIDRETKKVTVTLPFMKDPVSYFSQKFEKYRPFLGKKSNYGQALKRFNAQCRLSLIHI